MTDDQPESSFQDPEAYADYQDESTAAIMEYQKVRRPLMFHILIVIILASAFVAIPVFIMSFPLLGVLSYFRRLEDGFDPNWEPGPDGGKQSFHLETKWVKTWIQAGDRLATFKKQLKWEWYWRTWKFYVVLLMAPLVVLFHLTKRGFFLFMDFFFLWCWDDWYHEINREALKEKTKKRGLNGNRVLNLIEAAGAGAAGYVCKRRAKREMEEDYRARLENETRSGPRSPEKSNGGKTPEGRIGESEST